MSAINSDLLVPASSSSGRMLVIWCIFGLLLPCFPASGQPLSIVCPEIPPYCYQEKSEARGFVFEIGQEILRRLGQQVPISIQPLARALRSVQNGHQTIALWLGRVPEREHTVRWIAPILEDGFYIYTLKGQPDASTPEKARALPTLAASIAGANLLAARNFDLGRIETTASEDSNGKKLLSGRVDGWISTSAVTGNFAFRQKLGPDSLVRGVKLSDFTAYLVASLDTDDQLISDWKQAYETMVRDGFVQRLKKKYGIPDR